MSEIVLVGDIGGTNARFAITRKGDSCYTNELTYTCADFASPEDALRQYAQDTSNPLPTQMCLAVAGPVNNGEVAFTNSSWRLSVDNLQSNLGVNEVRLLNDFEAAAQCLPLLSKENCLQVGPAARSELGNDFTVAVLGPGTGLGVATLVGANGQRVALATEGGHVGFSPESGTQLRVLSRLRSKFGRVSNEQLISGNGIENLYWAMGTAQADVAAPPAAEIFNRANTDPLAQRVITQFFRILGQVAGDIALANGAFDGIYLAGGIMQRYASDLIQSEFRAGFENKGPHASLMQRIPTMLITHPQPGLLGAVAASS